MKRVLIIAYYWPPAGGPGVQRWLHFVKNFKAFNIHPVVYVPENPTYPIKDASLLNDVPNDVEVLKHPIREPYRWAQWLSKKKTRQLSSGIISEKKPSAIERLLLFVRGNVFIPDARVGWVAPSVAYLKDYISEKPVEAIVTTGPPHSLHLIGKQLQEHCHVKWVADFRDPWTTIHYHKDLQLTKASERKHKKMEAAVLNAADAITVTSNVTKEEFEAITSKPIHVITNGFEERLEYSENCALDDRFSIVHIGSLLTRRNPEKLWKVLAELVKEYSDFKEVFELKLVGHYSKEILASLEAYKLMEYTRLLGYVAHDEAIALQRSAQLLLLVEMDRQETRAIIPGKLFEYVAARRPIIALGPAGSDVNTILEETNAGTYFLYSEEQKLKAHLLNAFQKFQRNELNVVDSDISMYSRYELTRKMASILTSV